MHLVVIEGVLTQAMQILNPAVNSIPYLYVLTHQLSTKVDAANIALQVPDDCRPSGELWLKLIDFLNVFDPIQMRYVGGDWRMAVEYVDKIVRLMDTVRRRFCERIMGIC